MTANRPTGMGYQTSLHFNKVANEIINYANSLYEYEALTPAEDRRHHSHSRVRTSAEKHRTKVNATRPPTSYPAHVSRPPSSSNRRSVSRSSR
ncbi:unnamed protein product [Rotaria sp. Silwood2]|nr:unnamed protein product [Rotaria sp. Silwood2]CAF2977696.1 unnamed protein product [Rotaria sp. Silwood2]CAF3011896.1 unnamed protein product [Rotaria sp. Silwood2]CAF3138452.1 unnamed protein product [Rotaria sp. Silwood2]CAF3894812.1 unnamed protein product [Rotaria sp. Silwood2]